MTKLSKFAGLAADVDHGFRVYLIDPVTDAPIVEKGTGDKAFIEVLSVDSREGQLFDKEARRITSTRLMHGRKEAVANEDSLEQNKAKLARLTKAWLLVDPVTGEKIDVPCNATNAGELYSENATHYIYQQAWMGAIEPGNFFKRSAKISADTPSAPGATVES